MVKKRTIWPYLLVAPAVLIILCVVFIPVFNAIVMSFRSMTCADRRTLHLTE